MQVYINGQARDVTPDCTAAGLIEALGLAGRRVAMEINQEIVPRGEYARHRLREGDRIELVHAIGGG